MSDAELHHFDASSVSAPASGQINDADMAPARTPFLLLVEY
jgi:hypothetical protein